MKNNNTTIALFAAISILLFAKCNPCKGELNVTEPLTPEVREYFDVFKPGNYWIYQNQDGTKRDSVTFERAEFTPWLIDYDNCEATEHFNADINESSIFNGDYYINLTQTSIIIDYNSTNRPFSTQFDSITELQVSDISINGITYTEPIVLTLLQNRISKLYLCKNIGIIRAIVEQDTLNLINYKIL